MFPYDSHSSSLFISISNMILLDNMDMKSAFSSLCRWVGKRREIVMKKGKDLKGVEVFEKVFK